MIGNVIAFYQGDEILRAIASQRRFYKMRITTQKIISLAVNIGKITSAATRYTNFLGNFLAVIYQDNPLST